MCQALPCFSFSVSGITPTFLYPTCHANDVITSTLRYPSLIPIPYSSFNILYSLFTALPFITQYIEIITTFQDFSINGRVKDLHPRLWLNRDSPSLKNRNHPHSLTITGCYCNVFRPNHSVNLFMPMGSISSNG
jgi:hypothetical protein